LQRESEELAASAKPIYEFRQHAYDSAATAMAAFFTAVEAAVDQGPQAVIGAAGDFSVPLTVQEAAYLAKGGKRRALQQSLVKLFDRTLAQGVTGPGVLQVEQSRELIVRRGSTESSVQRDQVLTFAQYLSRAKQLHPDAGSSVGDVLYLKLVRQFFRATLILAIFWVLLLFYRRETYGGLRQVALIGGLFAVLLVQAGFVARFYPAHPEMVFMPFLAMMMTVLFNGRVSMIAAMILAVVVGLQPVFHDVPATFLCVVGGVTAALSVKTLRSRSNFYAPVLIIVAGYLTG